MITWDTGNLRFSTQDGGHGRWLLNVSRISDGHPLPKQMWFDHELTLTEVKAAAVAWQYEHPAAIADEPEPTCCVACRAILESDRDTPYQFDNALWIGFHGGYGMFTDNMEPGTTVLKNADYEAVLCHECAHELCVTVPWVGELLNPYTSHSHRGKDIPGLVAQGHQGWDLAKEYDQQDQDE